MKDAVGGEVKLAYTHNESDKAYKLLEAIPDINPDKPREAARETKPEYPEPRNPKNELQAELANWRRIEREILDCEARAKIALAEAEAISDDQGLSDEESIERIAKAQAAKIHFEGRLAARKRALGSATITLGREVAAGESWLRYQFLKLTDQRRSEYLEKLKSLFGLRQEDITRSPKAIYDFLAMLPAFREVQAIGPNQGLAADQSMLLARADDCLAKIFRAESLLKKGGE